LKTWLRRIRGAIGMGLTWAAAWFTAGMILLFIVGFGAADVPFPLFWGVLGFIGGVTFSGLLGLVDGRRRFDEMSMPRFAAWGGLGGFMLAAVLTPITGVGMGMLSLLGPIFAVAGAGCAAGSLALARMAEDGALEAGVDVEEVGLTAEERRQLLGDGA
jgi:hypothetical protein